MSSFERVYSVYDWYDGPRAGFADFRGVPHAFRAVWRDDLDDWEPELRLVPITAELLAHAQEDWAIWLRWAAARGRGEATDATHPALPADASRHAVLAPIVQSGLEFDPASGIQARGEFRVRGAHRGDGVRLPGTHDLEVRWTMIGEVKARDV